MIFSVGNHGRRADLKLGDLPGILVMGALMILGILVSRIRCEPEKV